MDAALLYGMVWPFLLDLVGASCPEDKVGRVLDCLLTPAGNHSDSALLSGNDVQEMGKYCKQGGTSAMMDCINTLLDNCTEADDRQQIAKFADKQKLNVTFVRFCEEFHVYSFSSDCISRQDHTIHTCMVDSENSLIPLGPVHRVCRHFHNIYECSTRPVMKACGRPTGDVIARFIHGITPPICQGYEPSDQTASAINVMARESYVIPVIILCALHVMSLKFCTWS